MEKSQPRIMLDVLHELVRSRGLRYRDIAAKLNVTERTVTRWFSIEGVDTRVIEQLCELAQVSFPLLRAHASPPLERSVRRRDDRGNRDRQ
jgi:transcriptional regulator with XRE-family HTH domain